MTYGVKSARGKDQDAIVRRLCLHFQGTTGSTKRPANRRGKIPPAPRPGRKARLCLIRLLSSNCTGTLSGRNPRIPYALKVNRINLSLCHAEPQARPATRSIIFLAPHCRKIPRTKTPPRAIVCQARISQRAAALDSVPSFFEAVAKSVAFGSGCRSACQRDPGVIAFGGRPYRWLFAVITAGATRRRRRCAALFCRAADSRSLAARATDAFQCSWQSKLRAQSKAVHPGRIDFLAPAVIRYLLTQPEISAATRFPPVTK